MRICCTSDLHGFLPPIPPCDLLLIAGDVCPIKNQFATAQRAWIRNDFCEWLWANKIAGNFRQCVMTWGNHDFIGEKWLPSNLKDHAVVLVDAMFEFEGLKIWGDPWTQEYGEWAFMLPPNHLRLKHQDIPTCDILLTHGPPHSFGDMAPRQDAKLHQSYWEHIGSPAMIQRIAQIEPKLVVFGHNHHGQGWRRLGNTVIANVALVGPNMAPSYPPLVFVLNDGQIEYCEETL